MSQYVMRYKRHPQGVTTGIIEASNLESAIRLGLAYCEAKVAHKFISVEDPVLIREGEAPDKLRAIQPSLEMVKGKSG